MTGAVDEVLPNGVRLAVRHRPDLAVTAVAVAVAVGWRDAPPGAAGTAHLFEHLVLSGAAGSGPGGYARTVEGLGGRFNASTRADTTVFHVVVPNESTEQALRLQVRLVCEPSLDRAALDRERAVVTEEVRVRSRTNPYGRFPMTQLRERLFARPGNRDDGASVVATTTPDEALAFHTTEYAPQRLAVAVVAGGNGAGVADLAREVLGAVPARAAAPRRALDEPTVPGGTHRLVLGGVPYPAAAVGYRVPDPGDLGRFLPVLVLAEVLGERWARSAPTGFVSASAGVDLLGDPLGVRDPTGLVLRGMLHGPAPDAVDLLRGEVTALERVAEHDVRAAGALLAARLAQGLDDAVGHATALAVRMRLAGTGAAVEALAPRLRAVRGADVARAAADLARQEPVRLLLSPAVAAA